MPRKKFNREEADKMWKNYTTNLVDSISETEKEGLEKGYSSYEIEVLWQSRVSSRTAKPVTDKNEKKDKESK